MRIALSMTTIAALSSPVLADAPVVVTDIPAVHSLVSQVMGDLGAPALLLDKGANAHSFQLRPSQAAALADADLLFWIGPEMTPWLERALAGSGLRGEAVSLLKATGTHLRDFGDHDAHDHDDDHGNAGHGSDAHDHDHDNDEAAKPIEADQNHGDHDHSDTAADHHNHASDNTASDGHDEHEDGHDDHQHDGVDPHAWLDPSNARVWLGLIAEELSHHDSGNAAIYAANAKLASERIAAQEADITTRLAPIKDKPFVVFHDAYGYFAGHFGLTVAGSIALGDAVSPGAARLREIQALLKTGNVACVFPEAQHDERLVATVVEGTVAKVGPVLDPSGSTLEFGPELYADLIGNLADGLLACLEG